MRETTRGKERRGGRASRTLERCSLRKSFLLVSVGGAATDEPESAGSRRRAASFSGEPAHAEFKTFKKQTTAQHSWYPLPPRTARTAQLCILVVRRLVLLALSGLPDLGGVTSVRGEDAAAVA